MDKPYFAIFLPVKETIKEGDWGTWDGNIGLAKDWKTLESLQYLKATKITLFLCGRILLPGDEIFELVNGSLFKKKIVEIIEPIDENQLTNTEFTSPPHYNIIGQISKGASWVQNGQEFNEDEWRFFSNVIHAPLNKTRFYLNRIGRLDEYCIQILGDCGHFH